MIIISLISLIYNTCNDIRIRYDEGEFNVDWKAECDQLNLVQVSKNKKNIKETKTNKHQWPVSSVQVQDLSGRNKSDYGGKDLWKRWVLSLEWKAEGVIDGENICCILDHFPVSARWGAMTLLGLCCFVFHLPIHSWLNKSIDYLDNLTIGGWWLRDYPDQVWCTTVSRHVCLVSHSQLVKHLSSCCVVS